MANKSATDYIASNDFEGAKEKFDTANGRWKKHWFNACYCIAEKAKEWATKYIFDPVALTIERISAHIKKRVSQKGGVSHVYLIKMFDDSNRYAFLKVGKADVLKKRFNELSKQFYARSNTQITRVEVLRTWTLPSDKMAESFEHAVHHYLNKFYENIPNDRYAPIELPIEQIAEIDRRYELMTALF